VNFYSRKWVGALEGERGPGRPPETAMGWEIHAPALGDLLRRLHARYAFPSYMVTENGCAMADDVRMGGRIDDQDRIGYIAAHLAEIHGAVSDGVPVDGYFVWSLMDNFEWAHGFKYRFGIVEVDFETQQRTPKASALWYAQLARSGVLDSLGRDGGSR
jgi:beta-glucosidase